MKKAYLIIGGIAAISLAYGGYALATSPKIVFTSIDWLKKTVHYEMSARGKSYKGVFVYGHESWSKTSGNWDFVIKTLDEGVQFRILKNGKVKLQRDVYFKSRTTSW